MPHKMFNILSSWKSISTTELGAQVLMLCCGTCPKNAQKKWRTSAEALCPTDFHHVACVPFFIFQPPRIPHTSFFQPSSPPLPSTHVRAKDNELNGTE